MDLMAVGSRWHLAPLPLPDDGPLVERPSIAGEINGFGDLVVEERRDPVREGVADRAGEARWLAAMSARYDERLAETYLHGAAELAARCGAPAESERRELGARQMLAELAVALRLPETTLAHRLTRITMLAAFPRLLEAAASGRVSSWHCDVMLDAFRGITDLQVLHAADLALVERAVAATAPELGASARRWRARHVGRTDEQRRTNIAARHVTVTPADEDMVWLSALIPAAAGVAIDERLSALAASAGSGDGRSHQQLRADALVDLLLDPAVGGGSTAERALDDGRAGYGRARDGRASRESAADDDGGAGERETTADGITCAERHDVPGWVRGIRPEVVLTVPVLALLGHSSEPAELEGFGPIDIETARQLAAQAPSFVRVLTHPETGAVLSVSRDRYRVPADLKRAVRLRDRSCRFPGCRRRARGCDVDHSTAWADGGGTDLCNLACLCRRHHRLKHEFGWQVVHRAGGVLEWTSPSGRRSTSHPATLWPPPPPPAAPPGESSAGQGPGGSRLTADPPF